MYRITWFCCESTSWLLFTLKNTQMELVLWRSFQTIVSSSFLIVSASYGLSYSTWFTILLLLSYPTMCRTTTQKELKWNTLTSRARNSIVTIGWKGGAKVGSHKVW
jgi:hypothetical protein